MRLNNVRLAGSLVTAIAIMLTVMTQSSAQTNMTGVWTLEVSSDQGITIPELTLVQEGMKLTGHYSSDALGENDITGMVNGSTITISFDADLQGQSAPVTYTGAVDEEGVWSGTLDIAGGLLTGTFKANKK